MQPKIKIRYSIFLKLIILILVFIVLVNVSIGIVLSLIFGKGHFGGPERFPKAVRQYVINNIGNPPDTSKAQKLSDELDLKIRIESDGLIWTNDRSIPTIEKLGPERDFRNDEDDFIVRIKGRPLFINKSGNSYIIFSPPLPRDLINETNVVVAVIIIITILTVLLYFSLRLIFGPVKKLAEGVENISRGDFESNIEVNRKDELGNLAVSINEMKTSISNMIKSKESLLIDVSHELRSPLTRIKLANEFIADEKIQTKIRDDVREMELMITEILESYRFDKGYESVSREKTDLIKVIERVISKSAPAKIIFEPELKEAIISGDKRKIETALFNIADNAVKYSDGKPVNIRVYKDPSGKENIFVSVKDEGMGIDESELTKIFEPFYRVDKSRDKKINGYGLGLSLVKKILDEHYASIEVKSKTGSGTEFIISFPDILPIILPGK